MLSVCVQGSTHRISVVSGHGFIGSVVLNWNNTASAVTNSCLVSVSSWNGEAGGNNSRGIVLDWSNADDVAVATIFGWERMAGASWIEGSWKISKRNHSSSDAGTGTARDGGSLVEPLSCVTRDDHTWLWLTSVG